MTKRDRKVDAALAQALFGLRVVANDWPCGRDPECGYYEASHCLPPMGSWYSTPDVVYLRGGEWPPKPMDPEPGLDPEEEVYASVEPVPFYSSTWGGMGCVVEAMHRRERNAGEGHYLVLGYVGAFSEAMTWWGASFWVSIDDVAEGEWYGHADDYPESASADTAPMAVACAALKTLGVELPGSGEG